MKIVREVVVVVTWVGVSGLAGCSTPTASEELARVVGSVKAGQAAAIDVRAFSRLRDEANRVRRELGLEELRDER